MPEGNAFDEKKGMRLNKGLLCAIPSLIFSLVCLYASITYPNLKTDYMQVSASFFPTVVSVIMAAVSLIMLIEAIVKPDIREPLSDTEKKAYLRGILAIADCIFYVAIFKPVGYIISSILALFAMMVIFGNRKWKAMIITSIAMPIVLYLVFYYALQTNLPAGVLQYVAELF